MTISNNNLKKRTMNTKSLFSTKVVEEIIDSHRVQHFDVYLSDTFLFSSNEYALDREYDMQTDEFRAVDELVDWLQAGGVNIDRNGYSASITVDAIEGEDGDFWIVDIPSKDPNKHAYPITGYTLSEAILACENGDYEITLIEPFPKRK